MTRTYLVLVLVSRPDLKTNTDSLLCSTNTYNRLISLYLVMLAHLDCFLHCITEKKFTMTLLRTTVKDLQLQFFSGFIHKY